MLKQLVSSDQSLKRYSVYDQRLKLKAVFHIWKAGSWFSVDQLTDSASNYTSDEMISWLID